VPSVAKPTIRFPLPYAICFLFKGYPFVAQPLRFFVNDKKLFYTHLPIFERAFSVLYTGIPFFARASLQHLTEHLPFMPAVMDRSSVHVIATQCQREGGLLILTVVLT
jgi:hypothetical protein